MRRAKKPWYRPRNAALALIGVAAAWLGLGVFAAWTAEPGRAVDYSAKLQALAEQYQPGSAADPDGWEKLLGAITEYRGVRQIYFDEAGGMDAAPQDWPSDALWPFDFDVLRDLADSETAVAPTRRAMGMLRERGADRLLADMAATPRAVRPMPPETERLIDVVMEELGDSRQLARWCAARMRLAAEAGDMTGFVAAYEQGLAIGRVIGSQPTVINHLVGIAIVSVIQSEAGRAMEEGRLDGVACREMLAAFDRQLPLPPMELALEGERLFMLDTIQWTHTDDGRGSGRLIYTEMRKLETLGVAEPPDDWADHPAVNVIGFLLPSKAETMAKANEYYDGIIGESKQPPGDRRVVPFASDGFADNLPRGFMLLRMMIPSFGQALMSRRRHEIEVAGARVMLALEVYRAERGRYPEQLGELVPGVLAAVPIDPFSGRPFAYRRLSEAEAQGGWRYTLYSVGADGVDDEGLADPKRADTALGVEGAGSDFVVNRPAPGAN